MYCICILYILYCTYIYTIIYYAILIHTLTSGFTSVGFILTYPDMRFVENLNAAVRVQLVNRTGGNHVNLDGE